MAFSEAELREAFEKVGLDAADADELVRVILEVQRQGDDFILTDETLLMLAAVSDDTAQRVLQMNPALSEMVARLCRNQGSLGELLAELRAARPAKAQRTHAASFRHVRSTQRSFSMPSPDVYEPDGSLVGELHGVPFPQAFTGEDRILATGRDELDVPQVVVTKREEGIGGIRQAGLIGSGFSHHDLANLRSGSKSPWSAALKAAM